MWLQLGIFVLLMHFVVSARKYRPSRFDDVVGQSHVSQTLKNALRNDHLAHAFLFCGPRGVGKTTCARILAKTINCQNITADYEACNTCSSCLAFNENASFNIIELDAASNNSVEHIRALIEQVRFQPQQGKYKVFIIDEVHMLSQQAFNAFLKTLEEPPPYAIFILATTEKHKIIPTILSRCQIYDFRRIQIPDIVAHLQGICDKEGIQADPDALHIIGQKADGALRDALSIFDRMVTSGGSALKYEEVIRNLNVLDYDYFFKLVDAVQVENLPAVMLLFDEILQKGFDEELFVNGLAGHIRNLLLSKDPATLPLLESSDSLRNRYATQGGSCGSSFLLSALQVCQDCDVHFRAALNKRLHVEMALVKLTYLSQLITNTHPLGGVEKKNPEPALTAQKKAVSPAITAPAEPLSPQIPKLAVPSNDTQVSIPVRKSRSSAAPSLPSLSDLDKTVVLKKEMAGPALELTLEHIREAWKGYLKQVTSASLRVAIDEAVLSLNGLTIQAMVANEVQLTMVQTELNLMQHVRDYMSQPKLMLELKVDPEKKQEAPVVKKWTTPKEKFQSMVEQNSAVQELALRFDLSPDED